MNLTAQTMRRVQGVLAAHGIYSRGDIAGTLAEMQKALDHKLLNRIEALGPPTLENLARFIFDRVQQAGAVTRVVVHRDSCGESCSYFGPARR